MFDFSGIYVLFYWRIRSIIKWILRKTTQLCELQRICYGKQVGCQRTAAAEYSLLNSKSIHIQNLIGVLNDSSSSRQLRGTNQKLILERSVKTVLIVKKINPDVHREFIKSFTRCLEHIWGYRQLFSEIEELRLTQFDSSMPEHEEKLAKLWDALMPDQKLEARITKQWQDIGFQGDDPKTDFRGMGLLGLDNLLFFAEEYTTPAKHVLSHSLHPQYGYAFAIVGINITSLAYRLLKDDTAKSHVYNACKSMPSLRIFHQFYCYLFYEFDKFWIEAKPKDVMEFSFILEQFEINIRNLLQAQTAIFNCNFVNNI